MLVAGRLYAEPIECGGLLFVGDPHVGSIKPGRRIETDWTKVVLDKLAECAAIARENNFFPVFTGDMFDDAVERDEGLKARLIRILKDFPFVPLTNVGNHDKRNDMLSDGDTLCTLATSDVVDAVTVGTPVGEFVFGGRRYGIGMTPYGQQIPIDVRGSFPDADKTIWITHHDVAFENPYPGSIQPFAIEGCDLVVNGHIHTYKKPVKQGSTMWLNPGNILRQSVDTMEHEPSVFSIGLDGKTKRHGLTHSRSAFNLVGLLVDAAGKAASIESYKAGIKEEKGDTESAFVSLLAAETSLDLQKSDDGSIALEEMNTHFEAHEVKPAVRALVRGLLEEAVRRRSGRMASHADGDV